MASAKNRYGLCRRDRRTPPRRNVKIAFHRQLIEDKRDGVARNLEVTGKLAARRQTQARGQKSLQNRAAQLLIEMPRQRFLAVPR
jgi:hypothetical protein